IKFKRLTTINLDSTAVSCVFMESCILPCSFQVGTDVLIHWIHVTAEDVQTHSYYYNTDQLAHQHQHFKGRTSMFKDQISRGNASLQLAEVKIQDQGRYKCYTKTSIVPFTAPVERVKLEPVENKITCSSEMIYPEPELTWSTSPPSNMTADMKTEVQRTEELLYNISSSLILSDPNVNYTCTVSTGSSRKRASWFKPTGVTHMFCFLETSENKGVTKGLVLGAVLVAVAAVIVFLVKRCRSQNNGR
uniref:Ig-like domain-containing protein n=1 Tax=Echeneis naucrates TaxID=173247 RepID=A0A665X5U7_ECHNA